jgi:hypothetical protein
MWKGVGRSGIGDQTIIGEYEDWDGLSMNGRQFKNRLTQETRDLSGADYWHQRKALEPKLPEDIPTYVHGRANVAAFVDPAAKPKAAAKTKSVLSSILLADRNYERLCNLSQQLDDELDSGQITDFEAYCAARKNIDKRLEKAWERCCKERPELLEPEQYPSKGLELTLDFEPKMQRQYDYSVIPTRSVFAGLDDGNVFKKIYTNLFTAMNNLSRLWNVSKTIIHEGVI